MSLVTRLFVCPLQSQINKIVVNGKSRVRPIKGKKRDLDQISKGYAQIIVDLKLVVTPPEWSSPKKEKELKKYREDLRKAALEKYGASLKKLDDNVLSAKLIPATYNKIRGEILKNGWKVI